MIDNKAVMQQAIKALTNSMAFGTTAVNQQRVIDALRAAIVQPEQTAHAEKNYGAMRSPVYSFDEVNKFVHESDAQYEELQALCLGLVSKLERNQAVQPEQTRPTITAYLTRHDTGDMLFFDKAEAQQYCDDDSEPESLVLLSDIAQLGWTPDGTFIDEGTKAAIAQPKDKPASAWHKDFLIPKDLI